MVGFQALTRSDHVPDGVGDIGTFSRAARAKGDGISAVRGDATDSQGKGLTAINATIRADNAGGLAFDSRLGFVEDEIHYAVPLSDGTPVDRISKRYALRPGD